MASKRCSPPVEKEEGGNGSQIAKRSRGLSAQDAIAEMRQLLREEVERVSSLLLEKFERENSLLLEKIERVQEELMRLRANHVYQPRPDRGKEIRYRLHFGNKLPKQFFTCKEILAEDGMSIQITLTDSNSGEVITSGPCSSVEVEIVVIHGDFVSEGQEYWTEKQFKDNVVPQRDGKAPLLKGKLIIKLNKGVGYLPHATFTDNSSWTRSKEFRLGVKLSQSECIEDRVQQGISEPFRVKDRRVKLNQKSDSPSLTDEVWRLKHIMNGGIFHQRLEGGGIRTVQEFLQASTMNQEGLRSLLGNKAKNKEIPNETWQGILTHAQKCPLGNERYSYCVPGENVVLIFNSIYELIGALLDGSYYSMGDLTAFPQQLVDDWKKLAFQNPKDIHKLVGNLPQPSNPINVPSVPGSSSLDPQIPYSDGTSHGGVQQSSSFQEPEVSNGLPVGSIRMRLSTATDIVFPGPILPEPQNSYHPATDTDEPATDMGFQQILQDISKKQDFNPSQQPAFFHGKVSHMNHILDGYSFGTASCTSRVDECMFEDYVDMAMDDTDIGIDTCMFEGMGEIDVPQFLNANLPTEAAPTSPRKWVKLIAGLKCGLSISKYLAARRLELCIVVSKQ